KEIVPKILASPKPTTFQHYLKQPRGVGTETNQLRHYGDSDALIRGHKLYWRQMIKDLECVKEQKEVKASDTQHTIMQPVRSGVSFRFRVYFENLTTVELGAR